MLWRDRSACRWRSRRSPASSGCWSSAPARAVLLLAFPLPFLLFIANTAPASRYLNPVLPFLALFAGWALARVARLTQRSERCSGLRSRSPPLPGARASVQTDLFFRQDDTRTLAARYIEAQHPAGLGDPDPAVLRAADAIADRR